MTLSENFGWIIQYRQIITKGLTTTVFITSAVGLLGTALGILGAWTRVLGPRALRPLIGGYVELIRNTPFLIQLLFVFFGLPSLGILVTPEVAAIAAMTLNLGAYSCEVVRAGIQASPRGQFEAAECLAMTSFECFWHVILRPSLARVWPSLTSQLVIVMLDSAIISQISVEDLTSAANFIQSRNFQAFEVYIFVTVLYLVLAVVLRTLLSRFGNYSFSFVNRK